MYAGSAGGHDGFYGVKYSGEVHILQEQAGLIVGVQAEKHCMQMYVFAKM